MSVPSPVHPRDRRARIESDRVLFARWRDVRDPYDRDALVERFLPLARHLARRYGRPDEPFEDLLQVACIGLVSAIERFDLDREVAFSSFAVPTIVGELKRHFRDRTWSIRVPRDLKERALKVDTVATALSSRLQRAPTVAQIAAAAQLDEESVLEALEALGAYRTASLDAPRRADERAGETLGDALGREDDGYAEVERRALLQALLDGLPAREREVLRLRFEEDLTQAEIGARVGVSQMQVSRLLRRSLAALRDAAAAAR